MERSLTQLAANEYDLLVIGGGIYGASVAWDAALRGLSVALIEKSDFASATSANSMKIIHGGFRYLQHLDFKRMRESIQERKALLKIAPHLVRPLPVLVPTYAHGIRGREAMTAALMINDLISFDRNQGNDPARLIPRGRTISRGECLEILPGVNSEGLTGGAIFFDAQAHNTERLVLSFVRSASEEGAEVANYVEATGLLRQGSRVVGVEAKDVLTGEGFSIRAGVVVNSSGPWLNSVLALTGGEPALSERFAKAFNLVTRQLFSQYAVGIPAYKGYQDNEAIIGRDGRLVFVSPWRDRSIVGTSYSIYEGRPDDVHVTEEEVQALLNEVNLAYPAADLRREDVSHVHCGLSPMSDGNYGSKSLQPAKRYGIHDHRQQGVRGLLSVVGVKYTTARHVAEKVVDTALDVLDKATIPARSAFTPLYDGRISDFRTFVHSAIEARPAGLSEKACRRLVNNYGSAYRGVLRYLDDPDQAGALPVHLALLKAEIVYGIREEMALRLGDIIFRCTALGSKGHPGVATLEFCARVMSAELGWSQSTVMEEVGAVTNSYPFSNEPKERSGQELVH